MKKYVIRAIRIGLPCLLFVAMACAMCCAIYYRFHADTLGRGLGANLGNMVGTALGSYHGMSQGVAEGFATGRETGLSAEDTEASIKNQFTDLANLEVLVASVKLSDIHEIGKISDPAYAVLYVATGQCVFSVDLRKAEIYIDDTGSMVIILPPPTGKLIIDQKSVERKAEYQRIFFNGSTKDGFDAYLNTMVKIQTATEDTLNGYSELVDAAKDAARHQITLLAQAVAVNSRQVVVCFADEAGD